MMGGNRGPLVTTKTVQELLFDGYSDPLLTLVRANGDPDIPKVRNQLQIQSHVNVNVSFLCSRHSTSSVGSLIETIQRRTTESSQCSLAKMTSTKSARFNCGTA